jgi:hypothetical protein
MAALLDDIIARIAAMPDKERREIEALATEATKDMLWVANPGPQQLARDSQADELFVGGSAGGGKSSLAVGLAICDHERSIIFRREYPQIRSLEDEAARILGTRDGYNAQAKVWRIPNTTKVLEFGSCPHETDKERYQGRAHDYIAFDELPHFSRSQYRFLIGWNRSTRPGQRCRVIGTGNPPTNAEQLWVIEYWAPWLDRKSPDPAMPGELRWPVRRSEDAEEGDEIFFHTKEEALEHLATLSNPPRDHLGNILPPRSRSFIPAKLEDNPDLMRSGYAAVLDAMPPELRRRLKDGEFISEFDDDEFQTIPTQWIIEAQNRWTNNRPAGVDMTAMGVDIAQGGADRSVIAPRYGSWFAPLITKAGKETPDGPTAAALIIMHMRDGCAVNIDLGGGWGNSAYDHLKSNDAVDLVGIVPGGASQGKTADGKLTFRNIRAEMWWRFREALDPSSGENIALPLDAEIRSELAAPKWKLLSGNAIQLEEKTEIKKRLGRSPDKGDAIVMAWFSGARKRRALARSATSGRDLPTMANLGGRRLHNQSRQQNSAEVFSASSSWKDEQGQ